MPYVITTRVPTDRGGQYVRQLAHHFERRVAVQLDQDHAEAAMGDAHLTMDGTTDAFTARIVAPDAEAASGPMHAVERHLIGFAKGRVTEVAWQEAPTAT